MSDTRISGCQLLARARPAAALLAHSTTAPQRVNMNFSISHVSSRSEEHTSELQSLAYLVCRLLLEKKKIVLRLILAPPTYSSTWTLPSIIPRLRLRSSLGSHLSARITTSPFASFQVTISLPSFPSF